MNRSKLSFPIGRDKRSLICLLGLPIDVMDLPTAVATIRSAAQTGRRCFISTPNLNFLMAAQTDEAFRESVLRSDLSLADGVSLLALARLIGVPLPERVAGADLFERLCESKDGPPIKVFFLGGPPDAARLAAEKVNQEATGVRCVGYDEAGFGDISSISGQPLIDKINASDAQFVVVSLGAKKGQAWIMHNQLRLNAPVICHLGAVVNFTAGTVRRAPVWMQRCDLEWLWRASTEKGLYKRYWDDGRAFLKVVARYLLTTTFWARKLDLLFNPEGHQPGEVLQDVRENGVRRMTLKGQWSRRNASVLSEALASQPGGALDLEVHQDTWLDLYAIGTLAAFHGQLRSDGGRGVTIRGASAALRVQLEHVGVGYLLSDAALGRMDAHKTSNCGGLTPLEFPIELDGR